MPIFALVFVLSGSLASAVKTIPRSGRARRAAVCVTALTGRPRQADHAKRFDTAFRGFDLGFDPHVRVAALAEALSAYRDALRDDRLGKHFLKKVGAARAALYRHLFDPNALVRANAAFGVVVMRNDTLGLHDQPLLNPEFGAAGDLVRRELADYLNVMRTKPFALVQIVRTSPAGEGWAVEVDVTITNEVPIAFAGRPLLVPMPPGMGPNVEVIVNATDLSGFVRNSGLLRGRVVADRLGLEGRFKINVPGAVSLSHASVFVDVRLNDLPLDRVILAGPDLAHARNRRSFAEESVAAE